MKKIEVLKWDQYGDLTIQEEIFTKHRRAFLCNCICGNTTEVILDRLRNKQTTSCWCYVKKSNKKMFSTHGKADTKIYWVYRSILSRCNRVKDKRYKDYGGRGIKCEWVKFEDFYRDMGDSYEKGLTIDRKDNDGNYCKDNCRWTTWEVQANNKRNNIK